jgi:hypothetical protein
VQQMPSVGCCRSQRAQGCCCSSRYQRRSRHTGDWGAAGGVLCRQIHKNRPAITCRARLIQAADMRGRG